MLQYFSRLEQGESKFHPYDNFYRFKKVQRLLQKQDVDGLLVINGMDSKENQQYVKLMNWLFLGYSGLEIDINEYLDSLNETIFLIMKDRVRIFVDSESFKQLQALIIQYPNVEIFSLTEQEETNKDECELLKISHFVHMMRDLKKVGVLLDKHKLEKWPLIQSYGLLGQGFFSMQYQVVQMNLEQLYKPHDKHSMKNIVGVISQRLIGHVSGCLSQLIDLAMKKRQGVTIEQLNEIFIDTIETEENKFIKRRGNPTITLGPYSDNARTIGQAGKPCLQMTVESYDLYTSVRFARTYFLTRHVQVEHQVIPHINEDRYVEQYEYQRIEISYFKDECFLYEIYKILIQGLQESIQLLSQDYRRMTEQFVTNLLIQQLEKINISYKSQIKQQDISVQFKQFNSYGEEGQINFKDAISFKLASQFFTIKIQVSNLISIIDGTTQLGQVVVGDSFILQENCYYIITKNIPYVQIVNTINDYSQDIETMKKSTIMPELGQQLTDKIDKIQLYIPSGKIGQFNIELPIYSVSLILHSKGFRVTSQELGAFIILFQQLDKIQFTEGLENIWMIAKIEPKFFGTARISIEFKGKAVDIYMKLLTQLQEQNIQFTYTKQPIEFQSSKQGKQILQIYKPQALNNNEIVDKFYLLDYLESKQLTILNNMKDLKIQNYVFNDQKQQDDRIGIILITGQYSSGKTKFAQNLQRYAQDFNMIAKVLEFSLLEQQSLDEEQFVYKLEQNLQEKTVFICVVPFYLNYDDLIQQLNRLSKRVYIRCVINKININNIYLNEHKQIIDGLMQQCLPGFSQVVIIDSFGNDQKEIDEVNKLFRQFSKHSDVFRVTNNIIQQSIAKEIYENTSYNSQFSQFLRNKMSPYRSQQADYQKFFIPATIPFFPTLRKSLRDLFKTPIINKYNNLNELEKLSYLIENKQNHNKIIYLKGFVRIDGQLDRLFEYTANFNYILDRQYKQVQVQMKNVKVDGVPYEIPFYPGWDHSSNLGLLIIGRDLKREVIQQQIEQLQVQMKPLIPLLTFQTVPEDIIRQIEHSNLSIGFDNGEFYDGKFIRDQDGNILKNHPKLPQLLQEYIEQENQIIELRNQKTVAEWNQYKAAFNL